MASDFFIKVKFAGSLLIKVFLGHSVSHAVQHRQHSTKRDVNLHVVKECLKNADIIRLKPANTNRDLQNIRKLLSRRQHEQRPWIIPMKSLRVTPQMLIWRNSSTVVEFDRAIDISSWARRQNFSSVKADVVAHRNLYVNQHAPCDFKIY